MNTVPKSIYCDECNKDIPIEELEDGTIIIHCPKCTGECVMCDCHLVTKCFPATPNVTVKHPDDRKGEVL